MLLFDHFIQISESYREFEKDIESRKRLKQKLGQIMDFTNKEIIYSEYGELEDGNMMLTINFSCIKV